MRKFAVLTGGGDCPGLNAVIRAMVKTAEKYNVKILGIRDGFHGAVLDDYLPLGYKEVSGILPRGGTILGASNRDNPFAFIDYEKDATVSVDRSDDVLAHLRAHGVEALLVIGGDGSMHITMELAHKGLNVIGVPKTIDNDLMATDQTFGFQTAVNTVQEALDRLHTTAESHHRILILEVMGRYAGWIALYAGIAGGADVILIPEIPYQFEKVVKTVELRAKKGKRFSIFVVAEGARPLGGEMVVERQIIGRADPLKLGGIGSKLGKELEDYTKTETRVTVLGHIQRGGSPNAYDRVLATRYGVAAIEAALAKDYGKMVALQCTDIVRVPISQAVNQLKLVQMNDPVLLAARSLGILMGD